MPIKYPRNLIGANVSHCLDGAEGRITGDLGVPQGRQPRHEQRIFEVALKSANCVRYWYAKELLHEGTPLPEIVRPIDTVLALLEKGQIGEADRNTGDR